MLLIIVLNFYATQFLIMFICLSGIYITLTVDSQIKHHVRMKYLITMCIYRSCILSFEDLNL